MVGFSLKAKAMNFDRPKQIIRWSALWTDSLLRKEVIQLGEIGYEPSNFGDGNDYLDACSIGKFKRGCYQGLIRMIKRGSDTFYLLWHGIPAVGCYATRKQHNARGVNSKDCHSMCCSVFWTRQMIEGWASNLTNAVRTWLTAPPEVAAR